jgi:hypothetical protein
MLGRILTGVATGAGILIVWGSSAHAEPAEPDVPAEPTTAGVAPPPGEELPFAIASEKRLEDEELAGKKEGVFLTGVPDFSSDPLNGVGTGMRRIDRCAWLCHPRLTRRARPCHRYFTSMHE